MKRIFCASVVLASAVFMSVTQSHAAPAASAFKKLNKNKSVALQGCGVTGATGALIFKVSLSSKRASVALPSSFKRAELLVGTKGSKFAACGASDANPALTALYLKESKDGAATEYVLALTQFEEASGVGSACASVRSWPGSFIYKTVGSHHFTDVRRNTIGLIMKNGANVATPGCIDILSRSGQKVADFGFYARGAGWFARYYGGIGCGDTINGATLAGRARKAGGSDSIYVRIGSTCYGPISASRCVGSKAC